jgi:hypothetical protein
MIGPLIFMTIDSGTTSKPIGTSPSSRIKKIPSPPSCMLTETISKRSVILCVHRVVAKAQRLGIYDLHGMYQEWNMELVAQVCATAWRRGNGYEQTLNFSIEGHRFELRVTELPTIFALADNDFHRAEIITERTISENELAPLYFSGNEHNLAQHMVCFPSILSSIISSATLSLQREVTASTSKAQQGIFFYLLLMIRLLPALVSFSGLRCGTYLLMGHNM